MSYYLRASRMYDTLLQMGRWFGYRPGYVDLCRLYTTDELREFYSHITMATDELRQEFELMAERGMTPREFGLRVRSHPSGLVITAANKMRNGTRMTVSYSADISETISFDRNTDVNRRNHERYCQFVASLGSAENIHPNHIWREVSGEYVADLLSDVRVHPGSRKARGDFLAKYIRSQLEVGGLVAWTVVLVSNQRGGSFKDLGGCKVYPLRRALHPEDGVDRDDVYRIRRLVSPADEVLDLTEEQFNSALEMTVRQYREDPSGSRHQTEPTRPSGFYIRRIRDFKNGLLLVYPLQEQDSNGLPFIGFAVSFPAASNDTPVEYVVNSVYWQEELEI